MKKRPLRSRARRLAREIASRRAGGAIVESEALLRSIIETLPGYVVHIDRDYRMVYLNRLPEGYSWDALVGANIFAFIEPEFHDLVRQTCEEVWKTGKIGRYEVASARASGG